VLDPVEIELPKKGDYDFLDPETGTRIRTSTEPIHAAYAKKVAAWRADLQHQAESHGIRWTSASTAESLVGVLQRMLQV
jgi:uncharacterized protein (DUF58 family)